MDFYSLLENERNEFKIKQASFSKNDVLYISSKDSVKGKLRGFLTKEYYQKEKVIRSGELFYGYVFSEWNVGSSKDLQTISYVLFSPERNLAENPLIFKKVAENIREFLNIENRDKKLKKLKNIIDNPISAANYEEMPFILTEGHLIYFCKVFRDRNFAHPFNLGLNLFIASPTISKQILYLPERYETETFKKVYQQRLLQF